MRNLTNTLLNSFFALLLVPLGCFASDSCLANIGERIEMLRKAGDTSVDTKEIREIIKPFAFGDITQFRLDVTGLKAKAYQRTFETVSEVCSLVADDLSGIALKGYTRFCGGIIRSSVDRDFFEELLVVFGGRGGLDKKGFSKVMEQLESTGTWISQGEWRSPKGIIYATGTDEGHRISHLFSHTIPNYKGKPLHSVFDGKREEILPLIDEAYIVPRSQWVQVYNPDGTPIPNAFKIPLGRKIGTNNEEHLMLMFHENDAPPNFARFRTAHPIL